MNLNLHPASGRSRRGPGLLRHGPYFVTYLSWDYSMLKYNILNFVWDFFVHSHTNCDFFVHSHTNWDFFVHSHTNWDFFVHSHTNLNHRWGYCMEKHDDVIKWKHFLRYWPFLRGIHRSPVDSPHKGQWRGALMFSLICVWINGWVNNREAADLIRYREILGDSHIQINPLCLYTCLCVTVRIYMHVCMCSVYVYVRMYISIYVPPPQPNPTPTQPPVLKGYSG